jgi:dipeptidyl aminopeptidase/acylaminoacyl peptidase
MRKWTPVFCLIITYCSALSQKDISPLTVEKIMRDPKWIGTSPSGVFWSYNSRQLFFNWNPEKVASDSLYYITLPGKSPEKTSAAQRQDILTKNEVHYNLFRTAYTYEKKGDIFFVNLKNHKTQQVTKTTEKESDPSFSFHDTRIVYRVSNNLFSWDISTGETEQLTNLQTKNAGENGNKMVQPVNQKNNSDKKLSQQEKWLEKDQLQIFQVLRTRKEKKEMVDRYEKSLAKDKELRSIAIEDKILSNLNISPDGRYVTYQLLERAENAKSTIVPAYITNSGFTEDIEGRTKVGAPQSSFTTYEYDREKDTLFTLKTDSIPGIKDIPGFYNDYPSELDSCKKNISSRPVIMFGPYWSPEGANAVMDIRSQDHKDRWLMSLDPVTSKLSLLDRQHDEAWIGGPGIGGGYGDASLGWINENTFWFRSEATGYSHLYSVDVKDKRKKALTSGNYEVQNIQLSLNKKYFYITTNEVHPGEKQFYRLTISDGKKDRLTTMEGANEVTVSPDEKYFAIRYSYFNKPWELYVLENKPGSRPVQVTDKAQSEEFRSYQWKVPELITFTARDGAKVYARLYKPSNTSANKAAVLFVHGAGYLQNAHKWWSDYFREYMFNNLLADNGYYVMDIDYRASAGYGRDWRTAIYRHMGGKDLDDNVDAARYLEKTFGVDPNRVGIYGGSYGGFITLMALFTTPDVFAAGAALRPVTNWANYNHGYTSDILNEPFNDSLAYRRSSPIYFAEGLKNHLLICHGMMDVNVHFQDAVELTQRLIELGKNNWELAPYPMEDHGFVEPSSWTDEYKRIFNLFEHVLKK